MIDPVAIGSHLVTGASASVWMDQIAAGLTRGGWIFLVAAGLTLVFVNTRWQAEFVFQSLAVLCQPQHFVSLLQRRGLSGRQL